ncbi:MAG TPA: VCBS repeat-containing protein [Gemmataceae bacterium]|nr:VCBS repeat-containing protein [Gemmataceae bacterium]
MNTPRSQSGFVAPLTFDAGSNSNFVVAADFNGGGIPDLAVTNLGSYSNYRDGRVSILLGNGDGTFPDPHTVSTERYPSSVLVADLNGDGRLDLIVVSSQTVRELLGNGGGTFMPMYTSCVAGSPPSSLAVGDFNADGWADLTIANNASGDVSLLLNDPRWR